jgi:hypothetical protein
VSPEALSALEALTSLLADARSGDLSYRGETISASTVEEWLKTNMPAAVDSFLDQVIGQNDVKSDLLPMLVELITEAKVISLEEAASKLGKSKEEVEECARLDPGILGFAGGRERVLFHTIWANSTP